MRLKILMSLAIAALMPSALGIVPIAVALPFNDDMVLNEMKTGRIMRPLVPGTVAEGMAERLLENREAALKLTNPTTSSEHSISKGKRLFSVHCLPCHGDISAKPYKKSKVGELIMVAPDLTNDMYFAKPRDPAKSGEGRSDGNIYGTIYFGSLSTLMPPLGYKLSPAESWDIVNYIRHAQSASIN